MDVFSWEGIAHTVLKHIETYKVNLTINQSNSNINQINHYYYINYYLDANE
jgi:hypothetical protein